MSGIKFELAAIVVALIAGPVHTKVPLDDNVTAFVMVVMWVVAFVFVIFGLAA